MLIYPTIREQAANMIQAANNPNYNKGALITDFAIISRCVDKEVVTKQKIEAVVHAANMIIVARNKICFNPDYEYVSFDYLDPRDGYFIRDHRNCGIYFCTAAGRFKHLMGDEYERPVNCLKHFCIAICTQVSEPDASSPVYPYVHNI